ncbi:monovalent cation/H(+) antiporter subunit G, partial [Streptomyces sp. TRM76130]|nr:monovalent cation/H(+) antiporter subunit G [Streptomyces sp. TRM76130]
AQTLGLLLVLVGAAAQMPARHAPVLLLVALFQLFTAPISSQIIGRTAYRTHGLDRDLLLRDELADRLARDGVPLHGRDRPQRDDDAER